MLISTKQKATFRVGSESFTTAGPGVIHHAPDWIDQDPYFHLMKDDPRQLLTAYDFMPQIAVPENYIPAPEVPFVDPNDTPPPDPVKEAEAAADDKAAVAAKAAADKKAADDAKKGATPEPTSVTTPSGKDQTK